MLFTIEDLPHKVLAWGSFCQRCFILSKAERASLGSYCAVYSLQAMSYYGCYLVKRMFVGGLPTSSSPSATIIIDEDLADDYYYLRHLLLKLGRLDDLKSQLS